MPMTIASPCVGTGIAWTMFANGTSAGTFIATESPPSLEKRVAIMMLITKFPFRLDRVMQTRVPRETLALP